MPDSELERSTVRGKRHPGWPDWALWSLRNNRPRRHGKDSLVKLDLYIPTYYCEMSSYGDMEEPDRKRGRSDTSARLRADKSKKGVRGRGLSGHGVPNDGNPQESLYPPNRTKMVDGPR
jgi:hypothetical protein